MVRNVNKARNFFGVTIVCLALLASNALYGCQSKGTIVAGAIDVPMTKIMERHDAYVNADSGLTQVERDTYLRSSELMRRVLDTATGRSTAAASSSAPSK